MSSDAARERDEMIADRLARLERTLATCANALSSFSSELTEIAALLRATRQADAARFEDLERRTRLLEAAE